MHFVYFWRWSLARSTHWNVSRSKQKPPNRLSEWKKPLKEVEFGFPWINKCVKGSCLLDQILCRIKWFDVQSDGHRSEWKNRTAVDDLLLYPSENVNGRTPAPGYAHHSDELLRFWSKREFIFPTNSNHVRTTVEFFWFNVQRTKCASLFLFHFWRIPFDWRTPFGYLVAITFEFISFFGVISTVSPSVCFAIGSYMWAKHIFVTEIIQNINNLNEMNINSSKRDIRAMRKLFSDIVQDFSDIKELSALPNRILLIFKW